MPSPSLPFLGFASLTLLCATAPAQVHAPLAPTSVVIRDVVLSTDESAEHVDVTIRSGHIIAITPTGESLPAGAQLFEGEGRLAQPGFIDTWTTSGIDMPVPVKDQDDPVSVRSDLRAAMRVANRKGVAPGALAVDVVDFGPDGPGAWRSNGFGALLAAPSGELLAGHGVLCVTRKAARRELVLNPRVFQFGELAAKGSGYPSTFMGYFAQLRQFFYDVARQAELESRYSGDALDPRPAWDPDLTAGMRLIAGRELYVVRANRASDIERWIRLADEFQLRLAIAGGREAWRVATLLEERGIPVLLDLDFGEEVDDPNKEDDQGAKKSEDSRSKGETSDNKNPKAGEDTAGKEDEFSAWHYKEPISLQLERRRIWEELRDNAKHLHDSGVRILFATGERKPKDLLAALRTAIEAGFDREVARRALTSDAARLLGLTRHIGELTVGRDASFGIWTDDPLSSEASLAMMVVDGLVEKFEIDAEGEGPGEDVDASGAWTISSKSREGGEDSTLSIEMNAEGQVTGNLTTTNPMNDEEMSTVVKGAVSGTTLTVKGSFDMGGMEVEFKIIAELNGDALSGSATWSGAFGSDESSVSGTRPPNRRWTHSERGAETHYSCRD